MRRLFHVVAPVVAAAALALAGASSVFAAGQASSASLDANFCTAAGATTFCYDINGSIHFVDATARSTQVGRGVFRADGTVVIDTIINTRSSLGAEPCTNRLLLRLVDYEAVVFRSENTCL